MIPEVGLFALTLALCFALLQALLPGIAVLCKKADYQGNASLWVYGQALFLMISFACLASAFLYNDFSIAYVAQNSHTQMPLIYRFTAIWGAHEGSLLLWVVLLNLWTVALCRWGQQCTAEFKALQLSILGFISSGFLLFLLMTSNPFIRLLPNSPSEGQGLNPILQDPGLAIHPPILYMGYVGFAIAFSFALAALLSKDRYNIAWVIKLRPWVIAAWCFLTLGITLGSWWAYRELGWGGWWFWDPVENASLMPWLAGTALLHAVLITEKQKTFPAWIAFLAILSFSLSLLGTFLVRSGILTSVHTFANDPARGIFLLKFLFSVIGASLLLFALRPLKSLHRLPNFQLLSRLGLLLLNNVIVLTALVIIMLGTLYPLILDALHQDKISVGAPYFNTLFFPLSILLLLLMGFVLPSNWQTHRKNLLLSLTPIGLLALLAALISVDSFGKTISLWVVGGLSVCYWVIFTTAYNLWQRSHLRLAALLNLPQRYYGMVLAHLGVSICAMGIIVSSHYTQLRDVRIKPGDSISLAEHRFTFLGVKPLHGVNYQGVQAGFKVMPGTNKHFLIIAERRLYTQQHTSLMQAGIHYNGYRDVYISLGDGFSDGSWAVRLAIKPLVRWIWLGGLLMLCGGGLAMFGSKRDE